MAFDLSTARSKVGLAATDASKDVLLEAGLNAAIAIAENYCDRYFFYRKEVAHFYNNQHRVLQLKRYPIEFVDSVSTDDGSTDTSTTDNMASEFYVHHIFGRIESKHHYYHQRHCGRDITVKYTGGYTQLPADLELALWGIFQVVWQNLNPGSSNVTAITPGSIQSITIPDVGTVTFAQGGNSSTATAKVAGSAAFSQYGTFFHLLDAYRDLSC